MIYLSDLAKKKKEVSYVPDLYSKQSKSTIPHVVAAPDVKDPYKAHLTYSNQNILTEGAICRNWFSEWKQYHN